MITNSIVTNGALRRDADNICDLENLIAFGNESIKKPMVIGLVALILKLLMAILGKSMIIFLLIIVKK